MSAGEKLRALGRAGRKGYIAYVTAGDPDLVASEQIVLALARSGADIVELGVPFSDPVADGPVNQRAAERALRQGVRLVDVLALAARVRRAAPDVPLVLFTYFNPILAMGLDRYAELAAASGVSAALIVDLPVEEAGPVLAASRARGLESVFLASPTTSVERLRAIDEASSAFVYYVSRTGVTGAQSALSDSLAGEVERLRHIVRNPVAIGFGISNAAQAAQAASWGDAIVIGSAIVQLVEESRDSTEKAVHEVSRFARSIREALDAGGR